ncbi:hypothetical protein EUGRSUZ_E03675 [Eucalyptus grandis]|uniref:Uncharacterized protein n=2 Tax=Eucalyptus grandis TaxID=71139 RepID=A0ACC3KZN1_EUCGR|nr:hypothetical protein EUGRSUZ_E03675 [Eucalyptus grandis]
MQLLTSLVITYMVHLNVFIAVYALYAEHASRNDNLDHADNLLCPFNTSELLLHKFKEAISSLLLQNFNIVRIFIFQQVSWLIIVTEEMKGKT